MKRVRGSSPWRTLVEQFEAEPSARSVHMPAVQTPSDSFLRMPLPISRDRVYRDGVVVWCSG